MGPPYKFNYQGNLVESCAAVVRPPGHPGRAHNRASERVDSLAGAGGVHKLSICARPGANGYIQHIVRLYRGFKRRADTQQRYGSPYGPRDLRLATL